MNKRIQELINQMDQAGLPYGDNAMTVTDRDLEYFAELIVKECADFIKPLGDWCGGHGEPQMPSTSECAKRLKEHFGVEE